MPSRSKTVAVTVNVWKELLQDVMLVAHDPPTHDRRQHQLHGQGI